MLCSLSTIKICLSTQYHLPTSRWCKHQSVNSTKYTTFRRWCVLSIESQEESPGGGGGDVTCMWGTPSEVSKDGFSWWKRVGKRKGAGKEQETEQADVTSETVGRLSSQEQRLCIPHRSFSVWICGACALTCVWVSVWESTWAHVEVFNSCFACARQRREAGLRGGRHRSA